MATIKLKVKITEVCDWEKNESNYGGIASHEGDASAIEAYLDEIKEKKETDKWTNAHLPFVTDLEVDIDELTINSVDFRDAICEKMTEEGNPCWCDILIPTDVTYEVDYENTEDLNRQFYGDKTFAELEAEKVKYHGKEYRRWSIPVFDQRDDVYDVNFAEKSLEDALLCPDYEGECEADRQFHDDEGRYLDEGIGYYPEPTEKIADAIYQFFH